MDNEVKKDSEVKSVPPYRTLNMNTYLHDMMPTEMAEFRQRGRIQSGYANIDAITNIYPGFYVLGGISSLGKTTFAGQMGDQMAKNGEYVIYFSLEQTALELASKSISRQMCLLDASNALTSLQIRKQEGDAEQLKPAIAEYTKFAGKITVVECTFRATIEDIEKYVDEYVEKNKVKPIVIIDYLQVIQAPEGSRLTAKDLIDTCVRRLKQIQTKHQIVLIALSSLNRQNYLTQIDYESFKESGGIEYTADVIWGLQLQVLHDDIFDKQAQINEKRQKVKDAKAANPRKIELVCLKNRFGISSYSCNFDYFPQFDCFKATDAVKKSDADPDGFMQLPDGAEDDCPFEQPKRKNY